MHQRTCHTHAYVIVQINSANVFQEQIRAVTMRSVHHKCAKGRCSALISQQSVCRSVSTAALKESTVDARLSDSAGSNAVNQVRLRVCVVAGANNSVINHLDNICEPYGQRCVPGRNVGLAVRSTSVKFDCSSTFLSTGGPDYTLSP